MTCCKVENPQTAFPKDREHRETGKQVLGPCFAQFPNPAQMHLGIYGFLEAASKAQSLFLGLLFSHLFLFISFHCRGPIVGHENVTGTIGRTRYLQDCREGRATIAGQEPAASIFSAFLLIPDHIHTPHSGSHEVFTTPLSPKHCTSSSAPELKPFISFLIMPSGRLPAPPPPPPFFQILF